MAWLASSRTFTPWARAAAPIRAMSQDCPAKCTGTMTLGSRPSAAARASFASSASGSIR